MSVRDAYREIERIEQTGESVGAALLDFMLFSML